MDSHERYDGLSGPIIYVEFSEPRGIRYRKGWH
jgi:hypothetical protein